MDNKFAETYKQLEQVDPLRDLEYRSAYISAGGIAWKTTPQIDTVGLDKEGFLDLYYYMLLSRHADKEIVQLSRKSLAFGKHLLATGNEASAVGSAYALGKDDWMAPAIRDLGAHLVRGITPYEVLCQACGRIDGPTKGTDASLHFGSRERKIVGLISHLGTMSPVGIGCAFAEKYKGTKNAVLAFSGEGASSTGDVHEALNIASVLELPFVLVIENNQWAFGTPSALQFKTPTLSLRSFGYGPKVEGWWIDGTKVITVYDTVRKALTKARDENIITIIETASMRMEGHALSDPYKDYVPTEQLGAWSVRDPITCYRKLLIDKGLVTEPDLAQIELKVEQEIKDASLKAQECASPNSKDIESMVYVQSPKHQNVITDPPQTGQHITYKQALSDAIKEEMENDPDIITLGEDIGASDGPFKVTKGLLEKFDGLKWTDQWRTKEPFLRRRVIDTPLAEAGFVGMACGIALADLKVIVEFQFSDFSSEAHKMLVNYLSTQIFRGFGPHHLVFRLPAGWARRTSAYHSINPESWFASTPGLKIVAPTTAFDAKGLLKAAIRDGNPVLFCEYKYMYNINPDKLPPELNLSVPEEDYVVPIGKARVVKEGTDLTIVTYGSQILRVLRAVEEVEAQKKASIEVIDLRTIVPHDQECINKSVRKTSKAIITCEAQRRGCYGQTIANETYDQNFEYLDSKVKLVAAADTPVPFAKELEEAHLPTQEKLVKTIYEMLEY